ncbi:MAG: hypothetical protein MK052_12120, partial [Alphaproteobacteria bacterium]|nr:hypothetical protein [Alphaproteobacteria bacterium]
VFTFDSLTDSTNSHTDVISDFSWSDMIDVSGLGFTDITHGAGSGSVLGFVKTGHKEFVVSDAESDFSIEIQGINWLNDGDFIF